MQCDGQFGNTISHMSSRDKNSVIALWQKPNNGYEGLITFKATVVFCYFCDGQKLEQTIEI